MKDAFIRQHETCLHIEKWQQLHPKLVAGFTTRNGGVSSAPYQSLNGGLHVNDDPYHVLTNRERVGEHLGFPLDKWVCGEQVHQTNIKVIEDTDKGKGASELSTAIQGVDGLITNKTDILCTAFFADCVPLFFYDPKTSFVGIAHAGWKGTVNQIGVEMVSALKQQGVISSNLMVAIGPCITKNYYEVDQHVINHIPLEWRENAVSSREGGRYLLDLKQLNIDILLQAGVLRNNIDVTNYCTFRDEDLFFSHRRDHGRTGRMLGFIGFSS
ncbi:MULTISPECIES: peptidoglycan editing factor PgeF [Virgibacillus]|uniref:Purine nucleoside phosphorylase n=2 Tax=Virgibacillus TaxID=84406 RepID=A0A024QCD6_9BACI|nr:MULTISPECIES: peptidoglycan editing factor PgeF [Virgibacillus]EQB36500.1 hypothetical protein M948_15830 [Virgibacillus sp. CM-4]MYL42334.1 peptidoglycan editing factor PgeF [Virgibacillus massiliensis]GGJ43424.1 laccase domain protein YlmD [Virgibacillus kapii]CDQ40198.1 Laccase domain protein [Virgibacillus massiliensis]